jgi:ubiquinone/menaquinone biosynthesis C-methylase UbiE
VMARQNRDAEREAIEVLDPRSSHRVVAIGVGAGVGVELLARRVASVYAVDPSQAMVEATTRRNRAAIEHGRVVVDRTAADRLDVPDESVDGIIAVNTIQMFDPLGPSLAEIARVLRPGSRFVTLTHDWAIERSTGRTVEAWAQWVEQHACEVGLGRMRCWRAAAEAGRSVAMTLTKEQNR